MKGGIPQGSALVPLLFLIYMNILPPVITNSILLQYADDTTLICFGSSPSDFEPSIVIDESLAHKQ